jgi:hypothetical protein
MRRTSRNDYDLVCKVGDLLVGVVVTVGHVLVQQLGAVNVLYHAVSRRYVSTRRNQHNQGMLVAM